VRDTVAVVKALADKNRLRALFALRQSELCLCQIIELLGLSPSTVSRHMSILEQARLVENRKSGRWIYYRLAGDDAAPLVREALYWVSRSLKDGKEIARDARKLKIILKTDPETLCRRQRKS